MNLQSLKSRRLLVVAALSITPLTQADVITTLNEGIDFTLQRSDAIDNRILVKNSGTDNNIDRVAFLKLDSSGLGSVDTASVRVDLERTAPVNQFLAGETLSLWGVPDLDPNEDFTQPAAAGDPGTWTTNPFISDTDGTDNNVLDSALVFLGSITFDANTSGDVIDFFGSAVTGFVQSDTNNTLSFLLTAEGTTDPANTTLFYNEDSGIDATQFYPSVMTNADAVPEPGSLALLGLGGLLMTRRRRSS